MQLARLLRSIGSFATPWFLAADDGFEAFSDCCETRFGLAVGFFGMLAGDGEGGETY